MASGGATGPILEARNLHKRYGGTDALRDAQFVLRRGEVHALLGSNGCGKSTLCKIMAGAVAADAGEVLLDGRETRFRHPMDARRVGVATVYQELSLAPTRSVADNVLLGREPTNGRGVIDAAAMRRQVQEIIAENAPLTDGLDPDSLVADLSVDRQQVVEILKALIGDPQIVFFDESTSSLDRSQVDAFFARVRHLKNRGVACVFISHRMDEIFAIADRVTVMRNGRSVATVDIGKTSLAEIVTLMVGGEGERHAPRAPRGDSSQPPVMSVVKLSGKGIAGIDFELRAGEILGLGGLHAQGQSALLLTLFGATKARGGTVFVRGQATRIDSPQDAFGQGIAYVSGDRARAGSLIGRPILENLGLSQLRRQRFPFVHRGRLRCSVMPLVERLKIKFAGVGQPIGTLSGGNQQKVIIARALASKATVLLLDDPTKGIDVQAKGDLYRLIAELCRTGTAVVLYSSEDAELLQNTDRVLVFNGGRVVAELAGDRLTEYELNSAALAAGQ